MNAKKPPKNPLQGYKYYVQQSHITTLLSMKWAPLKMNLFYLFMQVKNQGKGGYSYSYMAKTANLRSQNKSNTPYVPNVQYIPTKEVSCIEGYVTIDSDILKLDEYAVRIYLNFLRKPTKTWFKSREGLGQKFSMDTLIQWGRLESYLKEHKRTKTAEKIKGILKAIQKTNDSQLSLKKVIMQGDKVIGFKMYKEPPPQSPVEDIQRIPKEAKKFVTTIAKMRRKGYVKRAIIGEVSIDKKQVTYKGKDIIQLIANGSLSKDKAEHLKCQPSQILYRLVRYRLGHPPVLVLFVDDIWEAQWTGGEDTKPPLKLIKNA